jgi:hypothetical protein
MGRIYERQSLDRLSGHDISKFHRKWLMHSKPDSGGCTDMQTAGVLVSLLLFSKQGKQAKN